MSEVEQRFPDLVDPITQELLEDPITSPCCQRAFSRVSLAYSLEFRPSCPLCNADLSEFRAQAAPRNNTIASLVESAVASLGGVVIKAPKKHEWATHIAALENVDGGVSELTLSVKDSKFTVQASLCIMVVDNSGSMAGHAFQQVKVALRHILGMAAHNKSVCVEIILYNSTPTILKLSRNIDEDLQTIEKLTANGGTNFAQAFTAVRTVLHSYSPDTINSVAVCFLTDGQDGSGVTRDRLISDFRQILEESWKGLVSVHALGFSCDCDRAFLEGMRTTGNIPEGGTFRYSEPGDNDDALCQKLMGVFEMCSKLSAVPVTLECCHPDMQLLLPHQPPCSSATIRLPVDSRGWGRFQCWVRGASSSSSSSSSCKFKLSSEFDAGTESTPEIMIVPQGHRVFNKWLSTLVDESAAKILTLDAIKESEVVRKVRASLLLKFLGDIEAHSTDENINSRVQFLSEQVRAWTAGKALSLGRLSDMRFSSLFGAPNKSKSGGQQDAPPPRAAGAIADVPAFECALRHYSRNNAGKNRSALHEAISDQPLGNDKVSSRVNELIQGATRDDLLVPDVDGNNAVMFAAYCGQSRVLEVILNRKLLTPEDLSLMNTHHESAVTLAIKKRGYHFSLLQLLNAGACLPPRRKKALERFAIDNQFVRTASFLSQLGDGAGADFSVDSTMTEDYIRFNYSRAKAAGKAINLEQYLDVALAKTMQDLVKELLKEGAQPSFRMLAEHCFPPKPDHPETDKYLALTSLILENRPSLLLERDEEKMESLLHIATRKGSLPHVKYYLSRHVPVDSPNDKGNSALAVATNMRYPCIAEELLDCGADVNWRNTKGNTPLFGTCERGPRKIAELLVARGADVDLINENGDTMILICCRNGQAEVLEYLLDYVDLDFVNRKAHIDGFNAIMACAESDRANCMKLLKDYGVNLQDRTDIDNAILAGATPLHIASYYGRTLAITELLKLGADVDAKEAKMGCTALHLAVIQGYENVIRLLKQHGANVNATDDSGNTPLSYCRDRVDIREILIDPVNETLVMLAKGGFSSRQDEKKKTAAAAAKKSDASGTSEEDEDDDEQLVIKILQECKTKVKWLHGTALFANARDDNGNTALMYATMYCRREIVELLLDMGADPNLLDKEGCSAMLWSMHSKVLRITNLLKPLCSPETVAMTEAQIARVKECMTKGGKSVQTLFFLGTKPPSYHHDMQSTIAFRMRDLVNEVRLVKQGEEVPITRFPMLTGSDTSVVECLKYHEEFQELCESRLMWESRAATVRKVASGNLLPSIDPEQCMALSMYTNNLLVSKILSRHLMANLGTSASTPMLSSSPVIDKYAQLLHGALCAIPPFVGETFLGVAEVDRRMFLPGNEVCWAKFVSTSTIWRVAMENTPSYTAKSRKGTIFAIQSKTGRLINAFSQYSYDAEVIFSPGTRFRVTNWYHGTVIALGQANIREHSYKVKEVDDEWLPMEEMIKGDKSVIIELSEV